MLVGAESGTFLGGEKEHIESVYECVKHALPFDSAIGHVRIYPIKIPVKMCNST